MRAILAAFLALAAFGSASFSSPASADSAVAAVREGNQQPNGRWPAMNRVDCVVPYCIHNPDGSLNHDASTKALENAQNYNKKENGDVSTHRDSTRSDSIHSPVDVRSERRLALVNGDAEVARRFAPPASTAPQRGLFSVDHNIER